MFKQRELLLYNVKDPKAKWIAVLKLIEQMDLQVRLFDDHFVGLSSLV